MSSPASSRSPRYSRMVPLAEISDPKNDYNLNLPRYIDSSEPEDLQDIDAHLRGGIPNRDIDRPCTDGIAVLLSVTAYDAPIPKILFLE